MRADLPIYLSIYLPIHLFSYLAVYLPIYLSIYQTMYLFSYLSVYLPVYLSDYLSAYLCRDVCDVDNASRPSITGIANVWPNFQNIENTQHFSEKSAPPPS